MGFAARRRYRQRTDQEQALAVRTADTGACWLIKTADGKSTITREAGDAGSALDGPAAGLYVFLWNRSAPGAAGVTITGDPDAIATWQSSVRVSW